VSTSITGEVAANIAAFKERFSRTDPASVNAQLAWLLADEVERLDRLINTPHTADFLRAVHLEAVHQRERWAADHDAGKSDADWFWLVGYLAGKALHKPEKQVHHIITTAAALLNWHAAKTGTDTRMRPGISPPEHPTVNG
jgi:hypothetical protein